MDTQLGLTNEAGGNVIKPAQLQPIRNLINGPERWVTSQLGIVETVLNTLRN